MIKAYAKSDIGKVREINQDYYYISNSLDEVQLYMLADGMGGYKGGEIASKLAIQSAKSYIENNFKEIPKDKDSIIQLVGSSMEYANMVVYEKSKEDPELEGMGTTLEVCLIYNNRAFIGHVGDSRIYRIRKDFMRKLTQDHSYVQKLVKDGTITQEQAEHHRISRRVERRASRRRGHLYRYVGDRNQHDERDHQDNLHSADMFRSDIPRGVVGHDRYNHLCVGRGAYERNRRAEVVGR